MALLHKKVISGISVCLLASAQLSAQVNLPATLTFTSNATASWSDGIAEDGDGGSSNINGLTLQFYGATAAFTPFPGATMMWEDQTYFTGPSNFTGITPGPDPGMSTNGVPAMVIKSSNQAVNFNLQSIRLYDWGGVSPVIATYNNGVLLGSISPSLPVNGVAMVLSQADALTPSLFQNIDEIRMYPQGANTAIWIGMNNITLGTVPLPVSLTQFSAAMQHNNSVLLTWETAMEQNSKDFSVEESSDGIHFKETGIVPAKGNSTVPANYSFITKPISVQSYFRLKQNDIDGKSVYSKVAIAIPEMKNSSLKIYPNPANEELHVESMNIMHTLNIYALNGVLVKRISTDGNVMLVNISDLSSGAYWLQSIGTNGVNSVNFIKR